MRSASIFDTIAVELIASAPPSTMPALPAVAEQLHDDHAGDAS